MAKDLTELEEINEDEDENEKEERKNNYKT